MQSLVPPATQHRYALLFAAFFFFNDTATTEIYTLSLHDALPISFVGFLPIPMRHGMTLGELLRLANDRLHLHATLTVVPAAGWRRSLYFDATGLPWVKPSPNMPEIGRASCRERV